MNNSTVILYLHFEHLLVASSYFMVIFIYTPPYVLCLYIMHVDKTIYALPHYRIAIHMGFAELCQLIVNGMTCGIFTILDSEEPFLLNRILGAIAGANWFGYTIFAIIMAMDRLIHVCFPVRCVYLS